MCARTYLVVPLLAMFLLSLAGTVNAQDSVKVGEPAPDFTLPAATKDSIIRAGVRLADRVGHNNVILAFYPADWSGGCTKQMCTIRDNFASLSDLGAEILAISGDYVFSHREWANHYDLQFTLLSDHNHAVAKAYQSYNPQSGMNRRTIYVVDVTGKVAYIDRAYDPGSELSFNQLKTALERIKK